jgi:hypothetical protein
LGKKQWQFQKLSLSSGIENSFSSCLSYFGRIENDTFSMYIVYGLLAILPNLSFKYPKRSTPNNPPTLRAERAIVG